MAFSLAQGLPCTPVRSPCSSIATELKSAFKWSFRDVSLSEEVSRSSWFAVVVVVRGRKVSVDAGGRKVGVNAGGRKVVVNARVAVAVAAGAVVVEFFAEFVATALTASSAG